MPKYTVPVVWQMWGKHIIEADSLEEAENKVFEGATPLPEKGSYIDDSIELDKESMHYGVIVKET